MRGGTAAGRVGRPGRARRKRSLVAPASSRPPPKPSGTGNAVAARGVRLLWRVLLALIWLGSLAVVGLLVLIAAGLVRAVGNVDASDAPSPADADLILQASRAVQALALQVALVVFALLAYLLSLLFPSVRRQYVGSAPWLNHGCWAATALIWILSAALMSMLGVVGNVWVELLRLVPPLVLAGACLLRGTTTGAAMVTSSSKGRFLSHVIAAMLFVFVVVELGTFAWTAPAIRQLQETFQADTVVRALARAGLPSDLWLQTQASSLSSFLKLAPWLVVAWGLSLSVLTQNDLAALFSRAPILPARLRAGVTRWLMHPAIVGGSPLLLGWLWVLAVELFGGQAGGRALAVFPVYLLLLVPFVGFASVMASTTQRDGSTVTGPERVELLTCERPALWLLFFVAGLTFGNLFLWARGTGFASASAALDAVAAVVPAVGRGDEAWQFWALVVIAFFSSLLHYFLLVELPFWWGQRSWKAHQLAVTSDALRVSQQALAADLDTAPAGAVTTPANRPGNDRLVASFARFFVAKESARDAKEISVHSFKGVGDLLRKVGSKLGLAVISAVLSWGVDAEKLRSDILTEIINAVFGR